MNEQFIDYMNNVIGINPLTLNAQQQQYFLAQFQQYNPGSMVDAVESTNRDVQLGNTGDRAERRNTGDMVDTTMAPYNQPEEPPVEELPDEEPPVTEDPTVKSSEEILAEMDELFSKWSTLIKDASDIEKDYAERIIGRQYGGLKHSLQASLLARGEDLSTIEAFMKQADENITRNLSDKLSQVEMNKTKRLADLTSNQIRVTGELETALRSQDIGQEQFDERMETAKEQFEKEYQLEQDKLDFSYEQLEANLEMQPGVVDILASAGGQGLGYAIGSKGFKDTMGTMLGKEGGKNVASTVGSFASKALPVIGQYAPPVLFANTVMRMAKGQNPFKNVFNPSKWRL
jgi:hypothetical protein